MAAGGALGEESAGVGVAGAVRAGLAGAGVVTTISGGGGVAGADTTGKLAASSSAEELDVVVEFELGV